MRSSVVLGALAVAVLAVAPAMAGLPPEVRDYTAYWTDTPPVIDGVISAGEWDTTDEDGNVRPTQDTGDWRLLREGGINADFENNQFQMMWDNDFLYFQTTSDYGFWDLPTGGDGIAFGRDNGNLYLDPNLDGNDNTANSDGYQIAWNQYEGSYSCAACTGVNGSNGEEGSGWGFFTEAHIGGLFGNAAQWVGLQETVGAMNNYTVDFPNPEGGFDGGVTELAIPWTDINAPGLADGSNVSLDITVGGTESGTPENGDEWFINVARISSDSGNFLPAYNWTTSNYFAAHPHASMVFAGRPVDSPADFTKDGKVDGDDFLIWQSNFGTAEGATPNTGDANDDGAVDGDDFLIWQADFGFGVEGGGGSSAVPEPTSALLVLLSGLMLLRRKR